MAFTPTRDQQYRRVMFLAATMLVVAPVLYLLVVHFVASSGPVAPHPNKLLMWILLALGIIQVTVVLPFLTRVFLRAPQNLSRSDPLSRTPAESIVIIRMALIESVFIYGLLYFFHSREATPLVYFYALGGLAVALNWPTRDRFDEIANALEGK